MCSTAHWRILAAPAVRAAVRDCEISVENSRGARRAPAAATGSAYRHVRLLGPKAQAGWRVGPRIALAWRSPRGSVARRGDTSRAASRNEAEGHLINCTRTRVLLH